MTGQRQDQSALLLIHQILKLLHIIIRFVLKSGGYFGLVVLFVQARKAVQRRYLELHILHIHIARAALQHIVGARG